MSEQSKEPAASLAPVERLKLTLGQRLKLARQWAGLSPRQAAKQLQEDWEWIKAVENDSPAPWGVPLESMARCYDVRLEWLRGDQEEPDALVLGLSLNMTRLNPEREHLVLEQLIATVGPTMIR